MLKSRKLGTEDAVSLLNHSRAQGTGLVFFFSLSLSNLIQSHDVKYHLYAEDAESYCYKLKRSLSSKHFFN